MDFELSARSHKFERNVVRRLDESRKKREKELAAKDEQVKIERALQEEKRRQNEIREAEEEARKIKECEEIILTGGIPFTNSYTPYLLDGAEDDKIILPQSALNELINLNALEKGVLFFRIFLESNYNSDSFTHCGVREFTADEGCIGISKKILDSLTNCSSIMPNIISIKYVRLPKIESITIQPKDNKFSSLGPIKAIFEENLKSHTTLTENDIVSIWYRGKSYAVRVVSILPQPYGSLIDTDVELHLDVSTEYQQHIENTSAKSKQKTLGSNSVSSMSSPTTLPTQSDKEAVINNIIEQLPVLTDEPNIDEKDTILCKIRDPTGKTKIRRFLRHQPMALLFTYILTELSTSTNSTELQAGKLPQLTTRFPPRAYSMADVEDLKSFEDLGITSSQEMFLLVYV